MRKVIRIELVGGDGVLCSFLDFGRILKKNMCLVFENIAYLRVGAV